MAFSNEKCVIWNGNERARAFSYLKRYFIGFVLTDSDKINLDGKLKIT